MKILLTRYYPIIHVTFALSKKNCLNINCVVQSTHILVLSLVQNVTKTIIFNAQKGPHQQYWYQLCNYIMYPTSCLHMHK